MTHTLHRRGDIESLKGDFVVLVIPAQGINFQGSEEKMKKVWEIFSHHEVVNFGNGTDGSKYNFNLEDFNKFKNVIAHAVFNDRENLRNFLTELKETELGLSTVVSGLYEDVAEICRHSGIKSHTVEHSLGIHGNTEELPPENVLEVTTMCGHAMISANLVLSMVQEVKDTKRDLQKAVDELARQCICGIFNPSRCSQLIKKWLRHSGN